MVEHPTAFDAIVVGTGQAGKPLAHALADQGSRTAIIEAGRVGGTCVIDGCTPTKTMVASARVAHLAKRSSDFGVETGSVLVDMAAVRARMRSVVDDFSSSSRRSLEEHDRIDLMKGEARFVAPGTLAVDPGNGHRSFTITAPRIFLNVGGRPAIPSIPGLDAVDYLTSSSVLELETLPRHLAILGGGPIGLEFGQIFRRFGKKVTVIEQGDRLLRREDEDVSEALLQIFRDDGIEVLTSSSLQSVSMVAGGGVALDVETEHEKRTIVASHLLVAVGRTPNTDRLHLDAAGLSTDDQGFLPVDSRCRTKVDGIWALGDMTGAPPFTHIAYDDFRVVAADVLPGRPSHTRDDRLLSWVIYTDPELGRVGVTEAEAGRRGMNVRVAKLPMSSWARAIEMGETRGFVKCLVDAESDRIVGVAALAVQGGEIMSVLQTAMMGDLPYTAIRDAVYAHPTMAEPLENLFARLGS
ncbi:MAG: mercuric reductase [Gemmatimonadetes bacterium]|nr:mercuric reductase [Gemmatimonadota bacterium]NNF11704.1 mercuric reductase [Gemmatimonadota bacterium]